LLRGLAISVLRQPRLAERPDGSGASRQTADDKLNKLATKCHRFDARSMIRLDALANPANGFSTLWE